MVARAIAKESRVPVTPSSGNVFADLGFADPDAELAKVQLAICIQQNLTRRRLDARGAAKLIGISQRRLSALITGLLTDFSIDQLIAPLLALGFDIEVVVRKAPGRGQRGRLQVVIPQQVGRERRAGRLRNVTAIRTRAHHRAALTEIERLMDAKPNTARGRRLDALTRLVEAYESRHDPIEPPSHAAALRYDSESRRVPGAKGKQGTKAKPAARKTGRHR